MDDAADGDTIVIASGTYPEGVRLLGLSDLTLVAPEGAILSPVSAPGGIVAESCPRLRIAGLTLGVPAEWTGIGATGCPGLVLEEMDVVLFFVGGNGGGAGIRLERCDGAAVQDCSIGSSEDVNAMVVRDSDDLVVERCAITGNYYGGGRVVFSPPGPAESTDRARFTRNRFRGSGIAGAGDDWVVEENRFDFPPGTAISLGAFAPSARAVVSGNRIRLADREIGFRHAMELTVDQASVTRNRVALEAVDPLEPAIDGVQVEGTGNLIDGNRIDGVGTGIEVTGDQNTVRANRIASRFLGIRCVGSGTMMEANAVSGGFKGISLSAGTGCTLQGNAVRRCMDYALEIFVNDSTVTGNRVIGRAGYGFLLHGAGNTLTGNTSLKCRFYDLESDRPEAANAVGKNRFRKVQYAE